MPTFNRDALRKGAKAIDEAVEARKQGGGEFKPFLPNIFWKDDKDYRYLMFLNPLEEVNEFDLHPYIDCDDGRPHMCIAHSDPTFGGGKDEIQDQWGYKPRLTNLAVAVELEPITEVKGGRPKPVGFEVATTSFTRTARDDNDDPIEGEKEEVTVPVIGLVAQSPYNFFNQLRSFDASEAAIHSTPVKITRLGKKENVTYQITGYDTITPDLTNLFDYIENLSYLGDAPDELLEILDKAEEDPIAATTAIGEHLLNKRVDELADNDTYLEILGKITKPARFQDKKDEKVTKRPSQRRSRADGSEAPVARAREEGETETKESPRQARMNKLKARSRASKKSESASE